MSDLQIRISGGAVVIWPVLFLMAVYLFGIPTSPVETFLAFLFLGASAVSPSDVLCLLFPDLWREYANTEPERGVHRKALSLIVDGLRA